LTPRSGSPGSVVKVQGWGFTGDERVRVKFVDSIQGSTLLKRMWTDVSGAFTRKVTIPLDATLGGQGVKARGLTSGEIAKRRFTVT
jgi:hypothetical protein